MRKINIFAVVFTLLFVSSFSFMAQGQVALTSIAPKAASFLYVNEQDTIKNFLSEAGSTTIAVETNLFLNAKSTETWCKATIDVDQVNIVVDKNTGNETRTSTVTIYAKDNKSKKINIVQLGTAPNILVNQESIDISYTQVEFTLGILSNIDFSFELPTWISTSETPTTGYKDYNFIAESITEELGERSGEIIARANGDINLEVVISVTQTYSGYPRFIVLSENHFDRASDGMGATERTQRVLTRLFEKYPGKIDAILHAGDMTDNGTETQWNNFNAVFQNPDYVPVDVPVYSVLGNHDMYTGTAQESKDRFLEKTGLPSTNYYVDVKGYPVIAISIDHRNTSETGYWYDQSTVDFLGESLADANTTYPGKPIFVVTHIPVKGTGCGSEQGSDQLTPELNKYPQVIIFTGHSHHSIADTRSIYQDKFTWINDGSAWFSEVYGDVVGGIEPPGHEKVTEGLITTVKKGGDVTVERFDLYRDKKIAPDWSIKAPHDGSNFLYKGYTGGDNPRFANNAKPIISAITQSSCEATWEQATDDDVVYKYRVEVVQKNSNLVVSSTMILSEFYWNSGMPETLTRELSGMSPGTEYFIRVTAYDNFGKTSQAIVSDVFKTEDYEPNLDVEIPEASLMNVVFTKSESVNIAASNVPVEYPYGSSQIALNKEFSSETNSYIAKFPNNNAATLKISYLNNNTFKSTMSQEFTLETYYKANASGTMCPVSSQDGAGFGIEHNGLKPQFWIAANSWLSRFTTVDINTTEYFHVVYTFSSTDKKVKGYINGLPCGEIDAPGALTFPLRENCHWVGIGGDPDSSDGLAQYKFDGNIAYARIYGNALDQDQVYKLYNQTQLRKSFVNMNELVTLVETTIPAKIATLSSSEKVALEQVLTAGWKLINDFSATQEDINNYIATASGLVQ